MNAQLSFTTVQAHHDDLLRDARSSRAPCALRSARSLTRTRFSVPVLRLAWPRAAVALASVLAIATAALVLTFSSSQAATRIAGSGHGAHVTATAEPPLGLVRDPRTHLWKCVRVARYGHPVAR